MAAKARTTTNIVWLRRDLRLDDQPALAAALGDGGPVIPVYIWSPEEEAPWQPGAASRWWLHHALDDLGGQLRTAGSHVVLRKGPSGATLLALAEATGAKRVFWNRGLEPHLRRRDARVAAMLRVAGIEVLEFADGLLFDPDKVCNQSGKAFQVFSAFWRHCLAKQPTPAAPQKLDRALLRIRLPARWPKLVSLDSMGLLPKIPWDKGFYAAWQPTHAGAQQRLRHFARVASTYANTRDLPADDTTSRFSPYLHCGQLSPRQAWAAGQASPKFQAELGWREFAHHLLHHFPQMPAQPLRAAFSRFPWRREARLRRVWQTGRTGYPLIDAGMRQLWQTGWMHNRARMVCASFFVKHLGQPWTDGAAWFWDTLVDADLANNAMGWQWVSGCGADAAPFFRVFNPMVQGERFDPNGDYVRRYVPELASLPAQFIHSPWLAPAEALDKAGVRLGDNYPHPVVEHNAARRRAIMHFEKMRQLL